MKGLLFYKKFYPLSFSAYQLAGRNSTGRITSPRRLALTYRSSRRARFMLGLFKIYQFHLHSFQRWLMMLGVNQAGIVTSLVGVKLCRYAYHSLDPLLPRRGTQMPLRWLPVGTRLSWFLSYAHAGGTSLQLLRHRNGYTQLRLPSKKEQWFNSSLIGRIGINGNSKIKHHRWLSAGHYQTFKGRRSRVRGVAMNPVDHPLGGGQGKTSGGRPACSPWGQLSKGYRTQLRKVTAKTY